MNSRYIDLLTKLKKGNMLIFRALLNETFGKELTWKEVQALDESVQRTLCYDLEERITIHESPYDIKKLSDAIQHSRSGIGGSAITAFTCAFCEKEEWWENTAVPNICQGCAEKIAKKIIIKGMAIEKDVNKNEKI
jgi:hypothetical protein